MTPSASGHYVSMVAHTAALRRTVRDAARSLTILGFKDSPSGGTRWFSWPPTLGFAPAGSPSNPRAPRALVNPTDKVRRSVVHVDCVTKWQEAERANHGRGASRRWTTCSCSDRVSADGWLLGGPGPQGTQPSCRPGRGGSWGHHGQESRAALTTCCTSTRRLPGSSRPSL